MHNAKVVNLRWKIEIHETLLIFFQLFINVFQLGGKWSTIEIDI